MATALRATATNQSASSNTVTLVIPASAQADDIAVVSFSVNGASITATTPSGWTSQFGPDTSSTTATSWLIYKQLVAGDAGTTLSISLSTAVRWTALMDVISGGALTGALAGHTVDTASNTSNVVPTLANVPAGAYVSVHVNRRIGSGTAPTITIPSGYTADGDTIAQANGSGANLTLTSAHQIPASLGTVGGEAVTYSASSIGAVYAVAIPSASAPPPSRSGLMKVWTGSAWAQHPVKVWTGTAWVAHPAKGWDGTQWTAAK